MHKLCNLFLLRYPSKQKKIFHNISVLPWNKGRIVKFLLLFSYCLFTMPKSPVAWPTAEDQTFLSVLSAISLLPWLAVLHWLPEPTGKNSSSLSICLLYGKIKVTKGFKVVKTYKETLFLAYSLNWKWNSTAILSLDQTLSQAGWAAIQKGTDNDDCLEVRK